MKEDLKLFILPKCPYCIEAMKFIKILREENPLYKDINILMIDESKERKIANEHDYYFVPTFFYKNIKLHEGATTKDKVAGVFDRYLSLLV